MRIVEIAENTQKYIRQRTHMDWKFKNVEWLNGPTILLKNKNEIYKEICNYCKINNTLTEKNIFL